ncbi:hypothetical protein [Novosphingobium sp.]|uniref:hypothetical protein n=1 Tax=Novosphingobium sp. TaxID=1874826 RepID=UPI001EBCB267|nr:hypothetical protein [Novosphingobium sp.]MBK9011819.1 hypothetical protein [Novosphingobium sp.]
MEFVAPLNSPHVTDEERRLRMQKGRTVKDGDYVGFDLAFMDNASATSGTMYFRDNQADVLTRIEAEVAQMRAAHDRKFAFLGDRAPVFDAANAFLVARCKVTDGGKGLENAMRAERSGGAALPLWRPMPGPNRPAPTPRTTTAAPFPAPVTGSEPWPSP